MKIKNFLTAIGLILITLGSTLNNEIMFSIGAIAILSPIFITK
tara:strand:- start:404 stop:532 length:129 start_codon:yes stop_codon:yes gene_type:complete